MRSRRVANGPVTAFILMACSFHFSLHAGREQSRLPEDPRDPLLNQGPKAEAVGENVMVSTQHPYVTQAALKVLREGGNAVDAMITAVFLQHVVDYHMVSHFGSMSALYFHAASGEYYAINAVSERPRADRGGQGDASKVAIGGVIRGLDALAGKFGSGWSWGRYIGPAIQAAEEGVVMTSMMYGYNYLALEGHAVYSFLENPEARDFYMPDGHLVPVGFRWKMPRLADHLRRLAAEGPDYMYTGEWGKKFVQACKLKGYRVSLEDMQDYRVRWERPVRFNYRGHDILGSPPPDSGGLAVGYNLNILENFDLEKLGPYAESAEALEIIARTFGRVSSELMGALKDPLSFEVPSGLFLSKEYGKMGAEFVRCSRLKSDIRLFPVEGSAADDVFSSAGPVSTGPSRTVPELGSDHNVIVDGRGNWISLLHTCHGGAPGIFIDGVRAWGSEFPALAHGPGRRLITPITAIMMEKDGKPRLAMGSPGFPPQPVTEVLMNMVDYGMSPQEAVDAPRFWAFYKPGVIQAESRISRKVRGSLMSRGIMIEDLGPYDWRTGSMQIIWRDANTGKLHGIADPRRLGQASGF